MLAGIRLKNGVPGCSAPEEIASTSPPVSTPLPPLDESVQANPDTLSIPTQLHTHNCLFIPTSFFPILPPATTTDSLGFRRVHSIRGPFESK